jgi:hypothetical protein
VRHYFKTGDWILISERAQEKLLFARPRLPLEGLGPYRVLNVEYVLEQRYVITFEVPRKNPKWWAKVYDSHCLRVRPPKPSLAEKEQERMATDPWRKFRDEYLEGVFKPEPRDTE